MEEQNTHPQMFDNKKEQVKMVEHNFGGLLKQHNWWTIYGTVKATYSFY